MPDQRLERIEQKLDKIVEKIGSIDATLAGQHVSLVEHIRRTTLLEIKSEQHESRLESEIAPIKQHVAMVHGALKLLGAGVALFGAIEGLVALLTYLK